MPTVKAALKTDRAFWDTSDITPCAAIRTRHGLGAAYEIR